MPITIVDYGVGNVGALTNMLEFIGVDAVISGAAAIIESAEKLILPGVGAFDTAMGNLRSRGLVESLNVAVARRKVPVLGICLGMQIFAQDSEEGSEKGLGWIDGSVVRIRPESAKIKVPHVGWSDVHPTSETGLFPSLTTKERFYFAHSYHLACRDPADVTATIDYDRQICVAVSKDNVCGVQFHPEKSHRFGIRLLRTFANL